jgi:hypothetical protein
MVKLWNKRLYYRIEARLIYDFFDIVGFRFPRANPPETAIFWALTQRFSPERRAAIMVPK